MVKVLDKPTPIRREPESNGAAPAGGPGDSHQAVDAAVKEIRALVETGKLRQAREMTTSLLEIWPDDSRLQAAARVLAPPSFQSHKSERRYLPRNLEHEWLREHAVDYTGQWIALLGDELLAAGKELGAVLETLRALENGKEALLHFQPDVWNSW
jgi:hypothetical protein